MLPGQGSDVIRTLWLNVRARSASPAASISVRASSAESVQAIDNIQSAILQPDSVQPPVQPPVLPPGTGGESATPSSELSGTLSISLNDFDDPTSVGSRIRYGLRVVNNTNRANRQVHIELIQPQGSRLLGITRDGEPVGYRFGPQNTVLLPVIEFMRPGEELYFILVLVPEVVQEMRLEARVYSDLFPTPIQTSEATTVCAIPPDVDERESMNSLFRLAAFQNGSP